MFHSKVVYDKNFNSCSRVRPDYERVVNIDEDGIEHISFELVDYKKLQDSFGSYNLWSLESLKKAGINPDFGIKTGFNTRLDGFDTMNGAVAAINAELDKNVESENVES